MALDLDLGLASVGRPQSCFPKGRWGVGAAWSGAPGSFLLHPQWLGAACWEGGVGSSSRPCSHDSCLQEWSCPWWDSIIICGYSAGCSSRGALSPSCQEPQILPGLGPGVEMWGCVGCGAVLAVGLCCWAVSAVGLCCGAVSAVGLCCWGCVGCGSLCVGLCRLREACVVGPVVRVGGSRFS